MIFFLELWRRLAAPQNPSGGKGESEIVEEKTGVVKANVFVYIMLKLLGRNNVMNSFL